jgi:hypothetical protein
MKQRSAGAAATEQSESEYFDVHPILFAHTTSLACTLIQITSKKINETSS